MHVGSLARTCLSDALHLCCFTIIWTPQATRSGSIFLRSLGSITVEFITCSNDRYHAINELTCHINPLRSYNGSFLPVTTPVSSWFPLFPSKPYGEGVVVWYTLSPDQNCFVFLCYLFLVFGVRKGDRTNFSNNFCGCMEVYIQEAMDSSLGQRC